MYADGQGMGRSMSGSVSLWAFVSAENLVAGWISVEEIYARELVGSAIQNSICIYFIVG